LRKVVRKKDLRFWARGRSDGQLLHASKESVLRDYGGRFGLRTLVETGTYMGDMALAVADCFDHIITIELDPHLCHAAGRRLQHLSNVTVLQGDSAEVLPRVLQSLERPSLFWLDAHYCGWWTARGSLDTPIERELNAILSHAVRDHVVLIDDASCFTGAGDYPSLDRLAEVVARHQPGASIEVADDIVRIHR
jgi:hypothetical protein